MNKIPCVFRRDPSDLAHLLPEINPDCIWVFAGEGVPTRKYDGTCVMFDGARWWARREVRPGKPTPQNFRPCETDDATGKTMGWVPIEDGSFYKFHQEALAYEPEHQWKPGTYELCGEKINGNPEGYEGHYLVSHASADVLANLHPESYTYGGLRQFALALLELDGVEGIVWHHPDGRMAKLKGKDFK